jgi:hypothetical protein
MACGLRLWTHALPWGREWFSAYSSHAGTSLESFVPKGQQNSAQGFNPGNTQNNMEPPCKRWQI